MKLMIVDDNRQVREGIAKGIDWLKCGVDEVEACADGLEAYESLKEFAPDIIIADICMPNMDGIELLEKVRALDKPCRYLLLSAYSEFEYAQKAIRLGADDYILKPVKPQKLIDLVMKNIRILLNERQESQDYYRVYEKIFLNTLSLGEKINHPDRVKKLLESKYGLRVENNLLFAAVLRIESTDSSGGGPDIDVSAADLFKDCLNSGRCLMPVPARDNCYLLLEQGDYSTLVNHALFTELRNVLRGLNQKLSDRKLAVTAGISNTVGISEVHTAYAQAWRAIDMTFYKGAGSILLYQEDAAFSMPSFPEARQKDYIEQTVSALQSIDEEKINGIFSEIQKECSTQWYQPEEMTAFFKRLYFHLIRHTKLEGSPEFEQNVLTPHTHFDTILHAFRTFVLQSLKTSPLISAESYSGIIQNICVYLNDHFREPLTVESVAEKFDRTPNYISAKFKKEVGKSFTDYLIELRIQKATTMLTYTSKPISEIASEVGFNSYAYFSKTFRKYTGKNAGSFRKVSPDEA